MKQNLKPNKKHVDPEESKSTVKYRKHADRTQKATVQVVLDEKSTY